MISINYDSQIISYIHFDTKFLFTIQPHHHPHLISGVFRPLAIIFTPSLNEAISMCGEKNMLCHIPQWMSLHPGQINKCSSFGVDSIACRDLILTTNLESWYLLATSWTSTLEQLWLPEKEVLRGTASSFHQNWNLSISCLF